MKSRITAERRARARRACTACRQSANRSNCTRCGGSAAAISAWLSIGWIGSSSPPSTSVGHWMRCRSPETCRSCWLSPPGRVNHCSTSGRLTARRAMSGIARNAGIVRDGQPPPGVERGLIVALHLQKAAPRQRADFRAAEAFEQLDAPLEMVAAGGRGADQDQLRRMRRMAGGVGQRHHAAERGAEHDRIDDAERLAECAHVVAPLRQIPALARAVLAAAVAAMVEIDDLGDVGQAE